MPDHSADAHEIAGSPYEQMRAVMARHLCGWIMGHDVAGADQFLHDADLIMREAHNAGIRFHFAPTEGTANSGDGLAHTSVR